MDSGNQCWVILQSSAAATQINFLPDDFPSRGSANAVDQSGFREISWRIKVRPQHQLSSYSFPILMKLFLFINCVKYLCLGESPLAPRWAAGVE